MNYREWSNQLQYVMKTRQDDDISDHTSVVYDGNKTKLPCPIELCAICDENQIGKRWHQSIGLVYVEIETKLSRPI